MSAGAHQSYQNTPAAEDTRVDINNKNPRRQEHAPAEYDACSWILIGLSYLLVIISFPITIFFCLKIVKEYERAVIYRLGRLMDVLLPQTMQRSMAAEAESAREA